MNKRVEKITTTQDKMYFNKVQRIETTITTTTPLKLLGGKMTVKAKKPQVRATVNNWILKMSFEQLQKLIANNNDLSNTLYTWAIEDADFFTSEYLDGAGNALTASLGGYYDDFVTIREDNTYYGCYRFRNFEAWLDNVQSKFDFFNEDEEKTINRFLNAANLMYHLEYECTPKVKDYNRVLDKFKRLKKESEQLILKRLNSNYSYANTIEALARQLTDSICYNDFNAHKMVKMSDIKDALTA